MNTSKCLEYYIDSSKYNYEEVQKSIDETKKEYINKDVSVEINMNKYGMYVITFNIKNKNTIFNRIRVYLKKRKQNRLLLQERNYNGEHKYGQYKSTKTYKPY